MDTTILRSNLNSARMTCGLAQRPEYRDLMTAASKLTGERVNRSTHNHSGARLPDKVCGYRMGNRAERPLFLACGGAHVAAIGHKSASKTAKKDAERYPSVHKAACGGLVRIAAGY